MVPFKFLHCKVTIVPFTMITFWEYPLRLCKYPVSHITLLPTDFSIHQWFLRETIITGICLMVTFFFSQWNTFQLIPSTTTILCEAIHPPVSPGFFTGTCSFSTSYSIWSVIIHCVLTMFVALFGYFLENRIMQ